MTIKYDIDCLTDVPSFNSITSREYAEKGLQYARSSLRDVDVTTTKVKI